MYSADRAIFSYTSLNIISLGLDYIKRTVFMKNNMVSKTSKIKANAVVQPRFRTVVSKVRSVTFATFDHKLIPVLFTTPDIYVNYNKRHSIDPQ